MTLQIYGDRVSGNCLKVKWTAERLGIAYRWIQTDVRQAETRTQAFLALNPAGQVPLVVLEDGLPLAQSNAIILHLAEGSSLIPTTPTTGRRCSSGCSGSSTATSPTSPWSASTGR